MIESNPNTDDLFSNPKTSIQKSFCCLIVGIAIYVLSYFLIDETMDDGQWATPTSVNMLKFVIGMLLLPIGWLLWMSSIFRLSSHTGYHWIINILFLFCMLSSCFLPGAVYFVKWGILNWLEWDWTISG